MSVASTARWVVRLAGRHKVVSGSIAVFVAAVIAVSLATSSSAAAPPPPLAPSFSVAALGETGHDVSLSQYKDKPVVVNFWASWCTPCQQETPLLASWYKQQHGSVNLVGLDENDTSANALAFAHAKGVSYPIGFDPQVLAASAYNVSALPQTFFLNAQHRIVERVYGAVTKAELAQGVDLMNATQTPAEKVIEPS